MRAAGGTACSQTRLKSETSTTPEPVGGREGGEGEKDTRRRERERHE